jgi:hypothetical protein
MSFPGSVTHWIDGLKAGDQAAAQKLWECYTLRGQNWHIFKALELMDE